MNFTTRLVAIALPIAFLCDNTYADATFCNVKVTRPLNAHLVFADAGANTDGAPTVITPDSIGSLPVAASQVSATGGIFAASASASSSASAGLLRARVKADSLNPVIPSDGTSFARASGRANAVLWDSGPLTGVAGGAIGDPVAARLTVNVAGIFSPVVFIGPSVFTLSEGLFTVTVYHNSDFSATPNAGGLINAINPSTEQIVDLLGFHIGDTLSMYMSLSASANASNERSPNFLSSFADISNTAHLYLDILSGNATFASASGHDYRLAAVPPPPPPPDGGVSEPSSVALVGLSIGIMGWLARKRRATPSLAMLLKTPRYGTI